MSVVKQLPGIEPEEETPLDWLIPFVPIDISPECIDELFDVFAECRKYKVGTKKWIKCVAEESLDAFDDLDECPETLIKEFVDNLINSIKIPAPKRSCNQQCLDTYALNLAKCGFGLPGIICGIEQAQKFDACWKCCFDHDFKKYYDDEIDCDETAWDTTARPRLKPGQEWWDPEAWRPQEE